MKFIHSLNLWLAVPFVLLVRMYQTLLSPDHSWVRGYYPNGFCRYYPSCSSYALDGLRQDGIVALPSIVTRLLKCHPWSVGGVHEYHSKISSLKK